MHPRLVSPFVTLVVGTLVCVSFASHALCAVMRARIKEEYLGLCVEAIAAVLSMRGPCDGDAGGIYSSLFRMWSDSLDRIERVAEHVSACDLLLVMHV